ncbi:MAG TPA: hypothetical protein VEZ41_00630 [Allosphingosinicella sp.]|jgi:hypothetical protein|nr:hypothetical protein [Allosphingosinicella sp.]
MNEIRSYASLSGSLLARKGGAKPAMRPRPLSTAHMLDDLGWDDMGEAHDPAPEHVPSSIAALTPAPKGPAPEPAARPIAALTPAPRAAEPVAAPTPVEEEAEPVHVQQRVLADHFEQPATPAAEQSEPQVLSDAAVAALRVPAGKRKASASKAQSAGRKAAFTLRLDADRHLRLRLASALTGRSSQQLVTAALDAFIETLPDVGKLAQHVPAGTRRTS